MFNKTILLGRTTKDVELRQTNNGKSVANFTLAVNRAYDKETTDFFDCTIWGKQAENMEKYVPKGSLILVEGELQNDSYENKDGAKITRTKINASTIVYVDTRQGNKETKTNQSIYSHNKKDGQPLGDVNSEDLPF